MSSPSKETEEPSPSGIEMDNGTVDKSAEKAASEDPKPPAKRRLTAVIEISDTESDDSDVCAVTTYQASADEVKRIRGEDYSSSSSSSSSDYSSDSESPWEDDSIVVESGRALTRGPRAQLYPRANRMEDPKLNTHFKSQELIDRLSSSWKDFKDLKTEELTLTNEPFRVCLLHNVLANADIINNIIDDMNTLDWSRKKMDLYEFHQTADLASLTWQRSIRGIYEMLKTEVMTWVSEVTGQELSGVSASCSLYGPGDHLLVHDDLLADRRVAFILYLAPWARTPPPPRTHTHNGHDHRQNEDPGSGWSEEMGGALELLAHDSSGPTIVTKKILPANNMMAFFKVGTDSFHQVSEVLSMEVPRLSINGWFHGPPASPPPAPTTPPPPHFPLKPNNDVVVLSSWISPSYMSPRSRLQLQQHMERHSEASLHELLLPERCQQLLDELSKPDVAWQWAGPAHRRRYRYVSEESAGGAARELLRLAGSAPWLRLLADCTDLALTHLLAPRLCKWAPGDFTLLPAREQYQSSRLETVYYLGCRGPFCGGSTTYVAADDAGDAGEPAEAPQAGDSALVCVPPVHNALSLVYCDPGAASFVKYYSKINVKEDHCFYMLTCTYME